ncbi:MAG: excinuclease ABC subunit UvrA [Bacteroidota bacterium]|jgi:excinuclease ABC subunit A
MKKENAINHLSPIEIKGAKIHNLKNIDVNIPRNKLVVITGLSGSGKSSLAFDTLYAEGQRRYVESLSSYARQFLGKLNKPQVDYIKGISPAIAIEQKVNTRNPRSTVGTSTEIYDYLKLFFARIGKTYSPVSGKIVKRDTVSDVADFILSQKKPCKAYILSPFRKDRIISKQLDLLLQQGFSRIILNDKPTKIEELLNIIKGDKNFEKEINNAKPEKINLLIDRFVLDHTEDEDELKIRLSDSIQTGYFEGGGNIIIKVDEKLHSFSNKFEADGIEFVEPSVHFFSFNNPVGACKKCEGFGSVIGIDEKLVIPDSNLSVNEGAVACWKGETMSEWKKSFVLKAYKLDFPIHRPYNELNQEEKDILWKGTKGWEGINGFFKFLEENAYKIQYRVMLSRFRGKTSCPDCMGTRLRKDASYVKIENKSIQDIVLMSVEESEQWFNKLKLSEHDVAVSKRLLVEIKSRLHFLNKVGLGYLTLNRLSNTLSGGESQRINLATSLGSSLVGSLYVLDEPSIGLHSKDTEKLIEVLISLKELGNTVVVVEHDEDIMRKADQIIDIGPMAGTLGGNLVFQGNRQDLLLEKNSLTAKYLNGIEKINVPQFRKPFKQKITLVGVTENNLQNIDVDFPLNILTVITGVSGSGKTTLIKRVLFPALVRHIMGYGDISNNFNKITGDLHSLDAVEFVDQNPIGKSSRSNPVTYIKAYDEIRLLYSELPISKIRGYKPSHFSFNVEGGRCEVCQGEGEVTVEMQFMADIHLTCEACNGKRFKSDTLEAQFFDKSIFDILELTVDDAISFFQEHQEKNNSVKKIITKLLPLSEVGLGYIHLGQSSSTLSGGEAQRIKLASFLIKGNTSGNTLFIFDEPTTGLHFHDIKKLLHSFDALIKNGHSIMVIEHNLEVIKCADWVIDLGPDGGNRGGHLVFEGTPEDLVKCRESHTARYLIEKLN